MRLLLYLVLGAVSVLAQPNVPAGTSEFEVASVKLEPPADGMIIRLAKGGPGTSDPRRFRCFHCTLMHLIYEAYDVFPDQVFGPDWLTSTKYSVEAIVPEGASRQDFRVMLQKMLAERFQLVSATEERPFQVYRLVTTKDGPKLRPSPGSEQVHDLYEREMDTAIPTPVPLPQDKNGCPIFPPGISGAQGSIGPNSCMTFRHTPMPLFVMRLAMMVGMEIGLRTGAAHIVDQTGLTGYFDFEMRYAPPMPWSAEPPGGTSIFRTIEADLGLKLEKFEARLPVMLIRSVRQVPTEN